MRGRRARGSFSRFWFALVIVVGGVGLYGPRFGWAVQGRLENPSAGSFQSGIGVISGWVCTVNSAVEIQIDGAPRLRAAYGTTREDVHNDPNGCPANANSGFGLTFNWNLLGEGDHTIRALADGVEIGKVGFIVARLSDQEFRQDLSGTVSVPEFPQAGSTVTLQWQESNQNFALTNGGSANGGGGNLGSGASLENPVAGSFQSGIGVISGWVCTVNSAVEIQIDGAPRLRAAYGTTREDVHNDPNGCPANANSGFGLTFNWNLVPAGEHRVRAFVDNTLFADVRFTVTTLGLGEFPRGLSGEALRPDFPQAGSRTRVLWQESAQNFAIAGVRPPGVDDSLCTPQEGEGPVATWDPLCTSTGTAGLLQFHVPATQSLTTAQSAQTQSNAAAQGFFVCATNLSFVQGEQEFGAEDNFRLVDLAGDEVCRTLMPGETLDTVLAVNADSDLNLNAPLQALYNGQPVFAQTAPPSLAVLDVSTSVLDFGNVAVGTSQDLTFTVTNVGAGTLVGGVTLATQGGGVFRNMSEGTFNLGAGQSQIVRVRFTPPAVGSFTGSVRLSSNGGPATVNLTGMGGDSPKLSVSPTALDFGSVQVGSSKDLSFTVTNSGGRTLTGSATTAAPFSIVSGGNFSLGAGQNQTVTVRFSPASAGPASGSVSLSSNGGQATVALTGGGSALPQLSVSPTTLDFGSMRVGGSKDSSFTVTNSGSGTLMGSATTVAPFSIVSGGTFTLGAGQSQTVTVRFSPASVGPASGSVSLSSNGGSPTVALTGVGVEIPPQLTVSPTALPFGDVQVGSSKDLPFTVTNSGSGTLMGSATTVAPFSIVSGGTFTLGAGQSQTVTVRFSPASVGPASGSVSLSSNGGSPTVALTGMGDNTQIFNNAADFQAALGDVSSLAEDFESRSVGDTLKGVEILPGVVVDTNMANLEVFSSSSSDHVMFGFDNTTRQVGNAFYELTLTSDYTAVSFVIEAWDPASPGPITLEITFSDSSVQTIDLTKNPNLSETDPVFFGIISNELFIDKIVLREGPEISGSGNEEVALDDITVAPGFVIR